MNTLCLAMLLRAMGHEVEVMHDRMAAVAAAEYKPEFAFLDTRLPKLNGYELVRRLHELTATQQTVLTERPAFFAMRRSCVASCSIRDSLEWKNSAST